MTLHAHERLKRHVAVFLIKYAIQLSPARMHLFRQRRARQASLFHSLLDLPRKNFLDRLCLEFLKLAFLGKITVERWKVLRTPTPKLPRGLLRSHDVNSSFRLRAISISSAGAFFVFLINPCSTTNRLLLKQKSHRAIRLLGKSLRTSHRPPPSGRQGGIPTGQPLHAHQVSTNDVA